MVGETQSHLTLTPTVTIPDKVMAPCCHSVSGTCKHGARSRHHLEGLWEGFYPEPENKDSENEGRDPQMIYVHTVEGRPGYLFGTKWMEDGFISGGSVSFRFRSDSRTIGNTLEGEGQYADQRNPTREPLVSFILFSVSTGVHLGCFANIFLSPAKWFPAKLHWNPDDGTFKVVWVKSPKNIEVAFSRLEMAEASNGRTMRIVT